MGTLLWIIGIVLIVAGAFALYRKQWLYGGILIVVGMFLGGIGIF
ncbi:MAG: GPGG-motif small membrane protein [Actinomycetota bacterium]